MIVASLASACSVFAGLTLSLEHAQCRGTLHAHEPFRVADFVAAPLVFTPGGRALPYHMPVALSSHFDSESRSSRAGRTWQRFTSPDIRLISDPSRNASADPLSNPSSYAESWHQVRLTREGHELSLWIDGRKSSADSEPQSDQ